MISVCVSLPDGRAALELCLPLRHLLGAEVEVVVARLRRHPHATLLRLADHVHGVAGRLQVRTMVVGILYHSNSLQVFFHCTFL